jgi:hypothetical protein
MMNHRTIDHRRVEVNFEYLIDYIDCVLEMEMDHFLPLMSFVKCLVD